MIINPRYVQYIETDVAQKKVAVVMASGETIWSKPYDNNEALHGRVDHIEECMDNEVMFEFDWSSRGAM